MEIADYLFEELTEEMVVEVFMKWKLITFLYSSLRLFIF